MSRSTRSLLLCLALVLGSWRGSAAPVSSQQSTSAAAWFALISDIARTGASEFVDISTSEGDGGQLSASGAGAGGGDTSPSDVIVPPPIKLYSADGVTALQLVIIPVPTATQQCDARVPLTTRPVDLNVNIVPVTTEQHMDRGPLLSQLSQSTHTASKGQPSSGSVVLNHVTTITDRLEETNHYTDRITASSDLPIMAATLPALNPPFPPLLLPPTSTLSDDRKFDSSDTPSPEQLRRARESPYFPPVENSGELLRQFLEEVQPLPHLPSVLVSTTDTDDDLDIDTSSTPASSPMPTKDDNKPDTCRSVCKTKLRGQFGGGRGTPDPYSDSAAESPPLPRFELSMKMKVVLVAPRAGYTERYTIWWEATTGEYRLDYHEGLASTYHSPRGRGGGGGGHGHHVLLSTHRAGDEDVRRCVVMTGRRHSTSERNLPVLPSHKELKDFIFAGYLPTGRAGLRVERWRRVVRGSKVGGETLTYRHELLVSRSADQLTTTPLRYAVSVDSSLLGNNCDSYMHIFEKIMYGTHDPTIFRLSLEDACEKVEHTDKLHHVEPLREFSMLLRDTSYDGMHRRFKNLYDRRYADDVEEAIRKLLLISTHRFVSSGNRVGASFGMEVNFLGDRLRSERSALLGVDTSKRGDPGEPFPHSAEELKALRGRLPREFSWLRRGGVTSVRYQKQCRSCWAFAVTGAIEGALFAQTNRLVSLSEQSMLDCGRPYKTGGCSPTWPNFAYTYAEEEGMRARDEYPPYKGEVQQCAKRVPLVTKISGHVSVTNMSVIALKVALRYHGPTVVLIDGLQESFMSLKEGYYDDTKCARNVSNHAVLAVGYKTLRGHTYFQVKNSWSSAWAEGGYAWLRGTNNMCGILRYPSYPRLTRADVIRIPSAAL